MCVHVSHFKHSWHITDYIVLFSVIYLQVMSMQMTTWNFHYT